MLPPSPLMLGLVGADLNQQLKSEFVRFENYR